MPEGDIAEAISPHPLRWFSAQGVELDPYEPGELPRSTPESQDEFYDEESRLLFEIRMEGAKGSGLDDDDEDSDAEHWEIEWPTPEIERPKPSSVLGRILRRLQRR